jgi:hypothetical protein
MTHDNYDSRSEPTSIVVDRLSQSCDNVISSDILSELATRLDVVTEVELPKTSISHRQFSQALVGHFAIHNDVLMSLENFLSLLKSASRVILGISEIDSISGKAALVDGLQSFYTTYCNIIKKGFILSSEELQIISILKQLGTATVDTIVERLGKELPTPEIELILKKYECTNEQLSGFTHCDEHGFWKIEGL